MLGGSQKLWTVNWEGAKTEQKLQQKRLCFKPYQTTDLRKGYSPIVGSSFDACESGEASPPPHPPGHWTSFSTTVLTLFSIASPCRVGPVAPRELHAQLSTEETSHYIWKGFFVGACQYKSFEYQNTTFHDFSTYAKSEWLHVMSKAIKSLCFSQVTSLVVGFVHTPITKQHFGTPFPGPLERKSRPFCNDMANLWPLYRAWLRIFSVYFTKL